jgi:hypothetical protein
MYVVYRARLLSEGKYEVTPVNLTQVIGIFLAAKPYRCSTKADIRGFEALGF